MAPMPPPSPSTDPRRDRRQQQEIDILRRALRAEGEHTQEELAVLVGAAYWEKLRFDRAVAAAIDDGLLVRTAGGELAATGPAT